ncbi:MAG: hypothetical protein AB1742_04535 [bacterium]
MFNKKHVFIIFIFSMLLLVYLFKPERDIFKIQITPDGTKYILIKKNNSDACSLYRVGKYGLMKSNICDLNCSSPEEIDFYSPPQIYKGLVYVLDNKNLISIDRRGSVRNIFNNAFYFEIKNDLLAIAFVSNKDIEIIIFAFDSSGKNIKELYRDHHLSLAPRISPDGKNIVYFRSVRGIFHGSRVLNLSSGKITDISGADFCSWYDNENVVCRALILKEPEHIDGEMRRVIYPLGIYLFNIYNGKKQKL